MAPQPVHANGQEEELSVNSSSGRLSKPTKTAGRARGQVEPSRAVGGTGQLMATGARLPCDAAPAAPLINFKLAATDIIRATATGSLQKQAWQQASEGKAAQGRTGRSGTTSSEWDKAESLLVHGGQEHRRQLVLGNYFDTPVQELGHEQMRLDEDCSATAPGVQPQCDDE